MKAIIIGASSGIGRELAKILAREGYEIDYNQNRPHSSLNNLSPEEFAENQAMVGS